MAGINLTSVSIDPNDIFTGSNPVTVTYTCELGDESQNPVTVKLFVLSSLAVSFDVAKWENTLQAGSNEVSTDRVILAHSELTGDKTIRIKMRLEDNDGNLDEKSTTITYKV